MNKNNPTAVSSSMQHPYNYDGKETLSHPVAMICAKNESTDKYNIPTVGHIVNCLKPGYIQIS
jgi:hypothetical protein